MMTTESNFDVHKIRKDFPILGEQVNGHDLVYFDNAATAQKPNIVIDTTADFYQHYNANVHRGVHSLSERSTIAYEATRDKIKQYINATSRQEIIFARGATEAINIVAYSYAKHNLSAQDEVIITELEHHSNIVPWQMICEMTGAKLRYIPINDQGELMLSVYDELLCERTKLIAINHVSNALGTVNDIQSIISKAHQIGAKVLVDGAQALPHTIVDVSKLDCDFYAFSGHKLFAPTGIGVLYGKQALLEAMPPFNGGGDMIKTVSMEKTEYNDLPYKFEAGTPNIAGVIGLGAAIDYLNNLDFKAAMQHEHDLLEYATHQVKDMDDLTVIGEADHKASILSFTIKNIHPHDIATILDDEGIAIRAGHHCAMPIMTRYKLAATARASLAFYNTRDEVDQLITGIKKCRDTFL